MFGKPVREQPLFCRFFFIFLVLLEGQKHWFKCVFDLLSSHYLVCFLRDNHIRLSVKRLKCHSASLESNLVLSYTIKLKQSEELK